MNLRPENILWPILLVGLPLLVLAAACRSALQVVRARTEIGATVTIERLKDLGRLDVIVGSIWGLGGLAFLIVEGSVETRVEKLSLYSVSAFAGVLAALTGNLKLKLAERVKDDDASESAPTADYHVGNLTGCTYLFAFLGITGCFGGVPPLLLVELAVLILVIPVVYFHTKQRRESELLWVLAISVRNGRNLADEIDEHAGRYQGLHAHELLRLAANLRYGDPLGEALLNSGSNVWWVDIVSVFRNCLQLAEGKAGLLAEPERTRLLPVWIIAAISQGDATGTLREELDHVSVQHLDSIRSQDGSMQLPGAFRYLLSYGTLIAVVCGFLLFYCVPRHVSIFHGFDTELPAFTQSLIAIGEFLTSYWPFLSILLAWPISWMLHIGFCKQDAWRNLQQRYLMWFFRLTDTPDILRRLARVVRTERPLSVGLDAMAAVHQRRPVRNAFAKIGDQVRGGTDCWAAMLEAQFLSSTDVDLLRAAQRNHNLAWALDELATTRERRLAYRLQVVMQVVHPCLVLAVGVAVGFVVIAYFMPLVKLVNDLT